MISNSQKKEVIDKIIKSKHFRSAKTCGYLLQYLLNYHLKNEIPKESVIAFEFFARKSTFNPVKESTVRIYMYRLRIQLEKYYKQEGLKDDVVVNIPKGHYEIQFHEVNQNNEFNALRFQVSIEKYIKKEKKYIVLTSFLSLLVVVLFILWPRSPKVESPISKSDPIWKSFFKNDYPINIVIGDLFVFEEREDTTTNYRRIMDYSIISRDQFLVYKSKNPNKLLKELTLAELPHNSIFNIKDIMHVFYSFNKTFDIKFSQSLQYNEIKNYNNIYIGSFKRLQILNDLIKIIPLHIDSDHGRLTLFIEKLDTLETFQAKYKYNKNNYNMDYGLIAKLPGLQGEINIFITGFGYISQIELVRKLSTQESLKMFENEIKQVAPDMPEYFYSIFKVSGYELTGYLTELLIFQEIDANKYLKSFREMLSKKLE